MVNKWKCTFCTIFQLKKCCASTNENAREKLAGLNCDEIKLVRQAPILYQQLKLSGGLGAVQ